MTTDEAARTLFVKLDKHARQVAEASLNAKIAFDAGRHDEAIGWLVSVEREIDLLAKLRDVLMALHRDR